MKADALEAAFRVVLSEHYYAGGTWSPVGQRVNGWWRCACGVEGKPLDQRLNAGHRAHLASLLVSAAMYGEAAAPSPPP